MLYRDIIFLNKNYVFVKGDIKTQGDIVTEICEKEITGCFNKAVIPPFVDIHIHGGFGVDIMSVESSEIMYLSKRLYKDNVGAYLPSTVAKSYDEILKCGERVKTAALKQLENGNKEYAEILGIHIEGPFISKKYKGIMEEKYITDCEFKLYEDLKEIMGDLKIRFTIAPDCKGAEEFCKYVTENGDLVSIGHSNAAYEECRSIEKAGASSYTHLFNAMSPLHHREIGTAGAGLMSEKYTELICDNVHISKPCIELTAKLRADKIILITDAMEAMGSENGSYVFCGKRVTAYNGFVKDENGTLAGSVLTMKKAVENMAEITGYEKAVKMAAENPAKLLKLKKYGYIDIGKRIII